MSSERYVLVVRLIHIARRFIAKGLFSSFATDEFLAAFDFVKLRNAESCAATRRKRFPKDLLHRSGFRFRQSSAATLRRACRWLWVNRCHKSSRRAQKSACRTFISEALRFEAEPAAGAFPEPEWWQEGRFPICTGESPAVGQPR
jgi:hypothetical protein